MIEVSGNALAGLRESTSTTSVTAAAAHGQGP